MVTANSKEQSGIKIIKGTIKFKLANEDLALAAQIKYYNKFSLTTFTLVVFDKIIDHTFICMEKRTKTEIVDDFSQIFPKIAPSKYNSDFKQKVAAPNKKLRL